MAVQKYHVVIRPDAGVAVGMGHLMRMLALACGCRKIGMAVTFVVSDIPGSIAKKIHDAGCETVSVDAKAGSLDDANATLRVIQQRDADWLVLDGYCFNDAYQNQVKPDDAMLMVVDDFGHARHVHADLLLNQNAYADAAQYHHLTDTKVLCGIGYTMLKPEFEDCPSPHPRQVRATAKNILVTMGGSDADNYTLPVMQALAAVDACRQSSVVVDCVIGSHFKHEDVLRQFERESNFHFRIHRNVDRMDVLMRNTDLAITAGGSTCYELAKLGVPAIAIATTDNQVPVVKDLSKRNTLMRFKASQVQRQSSQDQPTVLSKFIKTLIDDAPQRQKMSDAGKTLIDGMGVNRVARAMYGELLEFRNVKMSDAQLLRTWRNDPEVRSVSFNSDPISEAEHRRWLTESLRRTDRIMLIAEDRQSNAIGKIQIDFTNNAMNTVTIGIVVGPEFRSRGLGTILIEKATSALFHAEKKVQQIVAQIKHGNIASECAFRKSGFISTHATTIDGQLAHQFILHRFYQPTVKTNPVNDRRVNFLRAA